MKALKYLLYTVLVLGTLWLLLSLFAKKSYRIERSMEIEAPRQTVFEQVRMFKNFTNWSPWHFMDPEMKISIEGTDGEVGAVYKWDSKNENVGKGYQKIMSVNGGRLDYEVDFGLGPSPSSFLVEGDSQKTKITWVIDMHLPFSMRAGGMLTDLNNYVGKDYENGLVNLKKYCEALNPKMYRGYKVVSAERPAANYFTLRKVVELQNVPQFLSDHYPKLIQAAEKAGAKMTGHPSGFFWSFDTVALNADMAAAIQLEKQVKATDSIQVLSFSGKSLLIEYLGDYAKTGEAHLAMDEYMEEKKLQSIPPVIEEYVTDPVQEPDTAKWLTRIIYFVEPKRDSTLLNEKK